MASRYSFLAALGLSAASINYAASQAALEITNQEQYPAFVQQTMKAADGTSIVLACGYASMRGKITPDPSLNDIQLLSEGQKAYTRFRSLDGSATGTTLDPNQKGRLVHNVVTPQGITAASCLNLNSVDAPMDCKPAKSTLTATQITAQIDGLEKACAGVFESLKGQLSVSPEEEPRNREQTGALRERNKGLLRTFTKSP